MRVVGEVRPSTSRVLLAVLLLAVGLAGCPGPSARDGAEDAIWTVVHVVDGDTVDVRAGDGRQERIRIVGIDTPERGECGFGPSSSTMESLVLEREVEVTLAARDERDRYGRLLAYIDVEGVDAGLTLIEAGLAVARYDSRDGYGRHPREERYVAADAATEHLCSRE
ncbi:MAG: thermonuclease family protein [Nitriliruptor sp.]